VSAADPGHPGAAGDLVVTHIGLCVTDLDRSRRFYEGALGFAYDRSLQPPDGVCSTLLGVDLPVGLTAVYLTHGHLTLELLHYDRAGSPPWHARSMAEPGLTHLSFTTADLDAALARVSSFGGEVVADSNVGAAVMVRDPDGQLLELVVARPG